MVDQPRSLSDILGAADRRVRSGSAVGQVWRTGFSPLDEHLDGGIRSGEVVLVGGAQGVGKTTFALQLYRNIAAGGGSAVYFSFEHDDANVLERLLVQEAYGDGGGAAPTLQQLRRRLEQAPEASDAEGLDPLLLELPGMAAAKNALHEYGERLSVVESSGRRTSADVIRGLVLEAVNAGREPVVFVDYLQKVSVGSTMSEGERVTIVVEALKDLALEASVPVVAIVAATQEGIAPGHRLRVHELRGSSALAYEADVILLLNNKYDIVARQHLTYDPRSAERFRQIAVVTIEKNRAGRSHVDLEFGKQFEHCRFDPVGNVVAEQLVDERLQGA